jgi:hypothetical protein
VIAIIAIVTILLSSPLLMRRHPCRFQAGIVALIKMTLLLLICDGIIALIVMTLLPPLSKRCCPCFNGIVVIIDLIVLVACYQSVIVAINAQASLPLLRSQLLLSSQWCFCRHQCAGVSAVVGLAMLPLLLVELALSPLL